MKKIFYIPALLTMLATIAPTTANAMEDDHGGPSAPQTAELSGDESSVPLEGLPRIQAPPPDKPAESFVSLIFGDGESVDVSADFYTDYVGYLSECKQLTLKQFAGLHDFILTRNNFNKRRPPTTPSMARENAKAAADSIAMNVYLNASRKYKKENPKLILKVLQQQETFIRRLREFALTCEQTTAQNQEENLFQYPILSRYLTMICDAVVFKSAQVYKKHQEILTETQRLWDEDVRQTQERLESLRLLAQEPKEPPAAKEPEADPQ